MLAIRVHYLFFIICPFFKLGIVIGFRFLMEVFLFLYYFLIIVLLHQGQSLGSSAPKVH